MNSIAWKKGIWPAWSCPDHSLPLEEKGAKLYCSAGHSYPRTRGIPRFVEESNYAQAFGAQWNRYRVTQLDSHSGTTITLDRASRCIGGKLWVCMEGLHVLEAGCGAGRFTEVLLNKGAYVTSVDLSSAVEANQDNFPQNDRHRIAQASILELPFSSEQYDVVFCLGVIQHTPNPEETMTRLYRQVKPGGWLIMDHYTHSLSRLTKTAPLFRLVLRKLPAQKGLEASEWLVDKMLPLHRGVRSFRFGQILLSRISPVVTYYRGYPELNDQLQHEWALLDTHDTLTAWYSHRRSKNQIVRILEALELEEIYCDRGGNGLEMRGRRPLTSPVNHRHEIEARA